jgi:DNA-binding PucR family transcriptional regulator
VNLGRDLSATPPAFVPAAVAGEGAGVHTGEGAGVHSAREAELLLELEEQARGQEDTYRLLVGVLLRDAGQLDRLRSETIAPLASYDAEHGTELLSTLRQFLLHHGSTTKTAEAMELHRHTVGYRLARVHEVSTLSPYESEGRERLSLGLKADQILRANDQVAKRHRGAD